MTDAEAPRTVSTATPVTIAGWLRAARAHLAPISDEAPLEAELLLRHASGLSRAALFAWPERALGRAALDALTPLLERRLGGEPLAHVLGRREFWSLEFEVGPEVLVPRPDTETLVERALAHIARDPDAPVLDAGTGSGAVAVAIASECANPVVASDVSPGALAVARRNAARHLPPGRLGFVRGDWLAPFGAASVGLLVSNPPYLAEDDPHLPALAHEPRGALVAGHDGLAAIAVLLADARRVLRAGAPLLLEHGAEQGRAVRALFERHGYVDIVTTADLGGRERVTEGRPVAHRRDPRSAGLNPADTPRPASRSASAAR